MIVKEIQAVNPLNRVDKNSRLPYRYDLNVYRGCAHCCQYCFARYSHSYLQDKDFFHSVYVKTNAADALDKTLSAMRVKPDIVNLGGVTDNYQPLEAERRLMPDILKVLIRHRVPALVSSKSDLVLRDMDLLDELNRVAVVNVAVTITTFGEAWRKLEPMASPPERRLEVVKEAKARGMVAGLHMMPVIPYLTDTDESLNGVFQAAKDCNLDYVVADALHLRGETKTHFLKWIQKEFPDYLQLYKLLYMTGSLDQRYKTKLNAKIAEMFRKYGVNTDYRQPLADRLRQLERKKPKQLSFFDGLDVGTEK